MDWLAWARDVGLIALYGGAVCLDRRAAFQLMISQPILAVSCLGWLLGNPMVGLVLGSILQLLWMGSFLFGAHIPPHETTASVCSAGAVLLYAHLGGKLDDATMALGVILGIPAAYAGRWLDLRIDQADVSLMLRADKAAETGDIKVIDFVTIFGLLRTFFYSALLMGLVTAFSSLLLWLARPLFFGSGEIALRVLMMYVFPAIGLGVSLAVVRHRRNLTIAGITFFVAAMILMHVKVGAAS